MSSDLIQGEVKALGKRGITEETCKKFGYKVGQYQGSNWQIAPYYKDGKLVAQHIRSASKDFRWIGESKGVELFGQHLWGAKGKMIVITEGEIDCMSVSQLQGNKWPVVSIPSGSKSAKKAISENSEWLEGFDTIVLMFDMDDPGQQAVEECAPLLSPGKVKIASLPLKDANEMLQAERGEEVIRAIWNAKPYRPDGLVSLEDILEDVEKPIERGLPWCFRSLDEATFGRRHGEVYGVGAGTGVGKTDFLTQQIAFDVTVLDLHVGCIFLEQKPTETAKRIAGKIGGRRFHVPDGSWSIAELKTALGGLQNRVTFYDSFGQTEWSVVSAKIRYMAVSLGIKAFYLDHLTAMADTADERGSLEQIMKEMAGLANELNIIITFVSHLATPEGKPHEEGGHVSIRHFKGARAIGFWSFLMIGLERNQQADEEDQRQITTLRILKDRYTGQSTGMTFKLRYEKETGRMIEVDEAELAEAFTEEEVF